ncbi:class II fructose-bisphosphate aldolase [Collinsella sp. AGMB00827]|uniref:Class II fructose-bisphosphate aldolase n=1 Tax=Collinsella ureilytica TaxID=2869515 RepID=A0ABS7MKZ9_9ACTN|nr:class II fructose-bisphosphate aldolase [Collinsella urealyticum]MBY4797751.1 class II fructose-bisphosphate aldolase [Collinsella urealyticum]
MLINLRDICAIAEQAQIAIAAFNVPSLEAARAAIDAAEKTGLPVILQHAEVHENIVPLDVMGPAMIALAARSEAQICVHLDHCEHLSYMRRALEMGFTGAMYDGSMLPYEENVANSARAAAMCAPFDCGLECELGSMGSREGDVVEGEQTAPQQAAVYTDPAQAAQFVADTGLDILACSFGTVHGLYKGEPHLSFEVLEQVRAHAGVPLVMHGGSGVSDADYQKAIAAGIRKINYYTYGAKFAGEAAAELVRQAGSERVVYWHDLTRVAYERLLVDAEKVITTFAGRADGSEPTCSVS